MTTKECSKKFKISVSDVRKCAKKELIPGAYKDGLFWSIPEDTICVIKENDIKKILIKILLYKNNESKFCSEKKYEKLKKVFEFLQEIDLIDGFDETENIENALKEIFITDKGTNLIFNKNCNNIDLNVNINNNFSLLKIG